MQKLVPAVLVAGAFAAAVIALSVRSVATPTAKLRSKAPLSLVVLYTASARGQIRSCNCTKFRYGGYGRELTLLKSIRKSEKNIVLIECGDTTGDASFQSALKADVTVKALNTLGYSAMVPGEEELGARGIQYVNKFAKSKLPILAANLFKLGVNQPIYSPYTVIKTTGGLRVGIIGILDPSTAGKFMDKSFGEEIRDPAVAARSAVKALTNKVDVIVAVYHGPSSGAGAIASIPGISLIISSHRSGNLIFPKGDNNEISAPIQVGNASALATAETNANWSLGRIDLALTPKKTIKSAGHKLIYLDRRYQEHPEMVKIYADYNSKVREAVLSQSAKVREGAEAMLIKRGLNPEEMRKRLHKSPFATADKCKDCHEEEYNIWAKSSHSHAMATLEKTHQEYDPECITCHTTGALVRNGFSNSHDTPELVNVQCEACHGPALEHLDSTSNKPPKSGEQTCRACHTDERTPDFDFDTAWQKIKH